MTTPETTVERIGGYRIVRRLATGGTSDVLLARAEGPFGFERSVVLKVLLSQFRSDDELVKMFAREAAAYARLSHPSIVRLFDFFALPGPDAKAPAPRGAGPAEGQLCMVLEHVDGPPLSRLCTMLKTLAMELDDRAAIYIASCVFDALAAAHAALDDEGILSPVIHRDVNPSNVLVPWDGRVKLADFGVAKVAGLDHQSVAGMIKGTYGYMAPEQVTGTGVTPRSDVYAGAIILWELLAHRRAFQRGTLSEMEALTAMAEPKLPRLETLRPEIDRTIADALRRALEPRPEHRTITAQELVSILSDVVSPEEGRERLVAAVSTVRNSVPGKGGEASSPVGASNARGSSTSGPVAPSPAMSKGVTVPSVRGAEYASRRGGLPRTTVAYAPLDRPDLKTSPGTKGPQSLPVPRSSAQGTSPALAEATWESRATEPEVSMSASARLAVAVPSSIESGTMEVASSDLIETISAPTDPMGRRRAARSLGSELEAIAPGLTLPDAIDAILGSSLAKPLRLGARLDSPVTPTKVAPPSGGTQTVEMVPEEGRAIGELPSAPPPLRATPSGGTERHRSIPDGSPGPAAHDTAPGPLTEDVLTQPLPPLPETQRIGRSPPPQSMEALSQTQAMSDRPKSVELAPDLAPTRPMPPYVLPPEYAAAPSVNPVVSVPHEASLFASPALERPAVEGAQVQAPGPANASRKGGALFVVALILIAVGVAVAVCGGAIYLTRYRGPRASESAGGIPAAASTPAATASVASDTPLASAVPAASETSSASETTSASPTSSASATTSASETTSATATPPVSPTASATSAPPVLSSTSAAADAVHDGTGVVKTKGAPPGRRIFVDDRTVGQTPESVTVKCGSHTIRLGSSGKARTIDVPCGGEVAVGDSGP